MKRRAINRFEKLGVGTIVNRAIKNGYRWKMPYTMKVAPCYDTIKVRCALSNDDPPSLNDLLANEKFVKALFGEGGTGKILTYKGETFMPNYKWQCMMLSTIFSQEEKIKYITENWV
jgi:hypothetical protein